MWKSYLPGSVSSTGSVKKTSQVIRYSVAFLAFASKLDAVEFYNKLNDTTLTDVSANQNGNSSSPSPPNTPTVIDVAKESLEANKNNEGHVTISDPSATNVNKNKDSAEKPENNFVVVTTKNSSNTVNNSANNYVICIERDMYQVTPPLRRKSASHSTVNGTIEQDADYQAFLKALETGGPMPPPGSTTSTANYQLNADVGQASKESNIGAMDSNKLLNGMAKDASTANGKSVLSINGDAKVASVNAKLVSNMSAEEKRKQLAAATAALSITPKTLQQPDGSTSADGASAGIASNSNSITVKNIKNGEIVTPLMEMIRQKRREKDLKKSTKSIVRTSRGKARTIQLVDPKNRDAVPKIQIKTSANSVNNKANSSTNGGGNNNTKVTTANDTKPSNRNAVGTTSAAESNKSSRTANKPSSSRPIQIIDPKTKMPIQVIHPKPKAQQASASNAAAASSSANNGHAAPPNTHAANGKEGSRAGRRKKRRGGAVVASSNSMSAAHGMSSRKD